MKFKNIHINLYGKYIGPEEKKRVESRLCHAILCNGSSWATGKFSLPESSYDEWRNEIKKTGKTDIFEAFAYALVSMINKEYSHFYWRLNNYEFTKAVVDANISGKKYSKTIPIVIDKKDEIHKDIESDFDSYQNLEEPNTVTITESTLKQIVTESVKRVLNEIGNTK